MTDEPRLEPIPQSTLRRLAWPAVVTALAARTRTGVGRRLAEAMQPLCEASEIRARLTMIAELREAREHGERPPVAGLPDVAPHLQRAAKEGILDGPALREVASLLRASADAAQFLDRCRELLPTVRERHPDLGGLDRFARDIERAIEPGGEVADAASPELAAARERVRSLHERLRTGAESLLQDPEWKDRLQESYFSVRGDRYVLPVKAAHRNQVGGIVHNVSNTAQTVFIEPPVLVEAGNELAVAAAAAAEAERQVLIELTRQVERSGAKIRSDSELLASLDFLDASAALASDLDAHTPQIPPEPQATFALQSLRHPLLVLHGKAVVANDVHLDPPAKCLVVTGPNAGGKTVSVSAVALGAVLLRHGLPIPAAAGSRLPLYRTVRAVIGDEQDLERDLSTFTAHLEELNGLLAAGGPRSLLLVDEICADTDPREGAALAVAVVESLIEKGAHLLLTTHLAALKVLAAADARLLAAAMGFDGERMRPTYQLRHRSTAGSSALEVAAHAGLPERVVERARDHLEGERGVLADALAQLEARQNEAVVAQRLAEEAARRAESRCAALESEREALEAERRRVRAEGRRELLAEIGESRERVSSLVADLQARPSMKAANETAKTLERLERETRAEMAREEEAPPAHPPPDDAPEPGDFVRVPSMGDREAEVLESDGETVLVRLGALKRRVPLAEVALLRRTPRRAVEATLKGGRGGTPAVEESTPERIDLRGMRVEEALGELEARLDRMFRSDENRAVIIHGHGTGALKKAVRDYLADSPYVSDRRPGERSEGGDGVTVVTLG